MLDPTDTACLACGLTLGTCRSSQSLPLPRSRWSCPPGRACRWRELQQSIPGRFQQGMADTTHSLACLDTAAGLQCVITAWSASWLVSQLGQRLMQATVSLKHKRVVCCCCGPRSFMYVCTSACTSMLEALASQHTQTQSPSGWVMSCHFLSFILCLSFLCPKPKTQPLKGFTAHKQLHPCATNAAATLTRTCTTTELAAVNVTAGWSQLPAAMYSSTSRAGL